MVLVLREILGDTLLRRFKKKERKKRTLDRTALMNYMDIYMERTGERGGG